MKLWGLFALRLWLAVLIGAAPALAAESYAVLGQLAPAASTGSVTCTNASPMVCTLNGHGSAADDQFQFTVGTAPTGTSLGTSYFIISAGLTANNFELSTTRGGTAINSSSTGSGLTGVFYHQLYTPSGSNSAVLSSMHVCNWSASVNDSVRIAVSPGRAALAAKNFVSFGTAVPFGDCIYPPAMTMANTDGLYVYSANGTTSFSVFGAEEN